MIKQILLALLGTAPLAAQSPTFNFTPITVEGNLIIGTQDGQLAAFDWSVFENPQFIDFSSIQPGLNLPAMTLTQGDQDPPRTYSECANSCKMYNWVDNIYFRYAADVPAPPTGGIYPLMWGRCEWEDNKCSTVIDCDFIPTIVFWIPKHTEIWKSSGRNGPWEKIAENVTNTPEFHTFTLVHIDECGQWIVEYFLITDLYVGVPLAEYRAQYGCSSCE